MAEAWKISEDHKFTKTCVNAYEELFGKEPEYTFFAASTNGITTASMGVPTIIIGPGGNPA